MTIVRCPRCRDEVSVPAKATPRALVRCPLCLEQYLLAEALANAPPPLIIIGGEVAQEAMQQPATGQDEYRLAGSGVLDARPSAAVATVVMPRPAVRGTQRARRPQGGGVILLANYVIGGVLGLAMGLLVLWWGFRKDPLELGPPVAQYAPWIVPEAFRTAPKTDSNSEAAPKTTISSNERRATSKKNKATAEPADTSELQTLPGLDEPARLPAAASPAIEAPKLNERGANEQKDRASPASATTTDEGETSPPMPDLRDLLP